MKKSGLLNSTVLTALVILALSAALPMLANAGGESHMVSAGNRNFSRALGVNSSLFPKRAAQSRGRRYLPSMQFITFDLPPNGIHGDTTTIGINPAGEITGSYYDGSTFHGYLIEPDGTILTIDPPGSTGSFVGGYFGSLPINPAGAITGWYGDVSGSHGFVRSPDGTFTTFDAPGGTNGTSDVCCITPDGAVAGTSPAGEGFVRSPEGDFSLFNPEGSVGTFPTGMNPAGVVTGTYLDASGVEHGFVRSTDGAMTTFDVPGTNPLCGTEPSAINPDGTIVGIWFDENFCQNHGFVRSKNGNIQTFDPSGTVDDFPSAISPSGAIVGQYCDESACHGYLRTKSGNFVVLDPSGSVYSAAEAITPGGVVVGTYQNAAGTEYGFLYKPD